jgi:hypothetical protein
MESNPAQFYDYFYLWSCCGWDHQHRRVLVGGRPESSKGLISLATRKDGTYYKRICQTAGCRKEFRTRSDALKHLSNAGHDFERVRIHAGTRSRGLRGERNPHAKLDWATVYEIRERLAAGWSTYQVSRHYQGKGYKGVTQQNISNIGSFKTWSLEYQVG